MVAIAWPIWPTGIDGTNKTWDSRWCISETT
jgi:hypothetical protein